ncbi:MAG: helix-turn-helix transcriptional regulator [bacterium]|nr:helix-turn-helix transcriptional regulator [bacterium]
MEGFGKRLVAAREKKGYNQKQFAELLGITPTRLNYWEKDKREPDFFMFTQIINTLGIDANQLLGIECPMNEAITKTEKELIEAYRSHPEMQAAVNKMLDITEESTVGETVIKDIAEEVESAMNQAKSNV